MPWISVLYNRRRDVTDVSNSHVYPRFPTPRCTGSEVEQNLQKEYAALAELMKVLTEATSTLPEELQNEITENLFKEQAVCY